MTASQSACSQLSATSQIALSCNLGQLLPFLWAAWQSVTMGSVRVLLQGVPTAFVVETPDLGWEPCDSGVGSKTQFVCRVAEGDSEGVELKQSRLVRLCRESRPVRLLSMAFESRSVVLNHC